MNSVNKSTLTSICNVSSITELGLWLFIDDKEYFVSFEDYPEFKKASVNKIFKVTMISPKQLHWEKLDCDIELDALENPEKFSLHFKIDTSS